MSADPNSVEAIQGRTAEHGEQLLAVHKRGKGRPRLTEGEQPVRVEVLLPRAVCDTIDATGRKRSEYIREAIAEKQEREAGQVDSVTT